MDDIVAAQLEASGAAFLVVADDGGILSYDRRFIEHWRVPEDVLERRTRASLVAWLRASGGDAEATFAALLESDAPPQEGEIVAVDGRAVGYTTTDARGGTVRVWSFVDRSTLHHLTTALREAGSLIRMLDAHAEGTILEVGSDACIIGLWVTEASHPWDVGVSDTELQGRSVADLIGDAGPEVVAQLRAVFDDGKTRRLEITRNDEGSHHLFAVEIRLMPTDDNEAPRVTVMLREVTDQRRMEAKLLETERLASVGLLAAGVAHEVNNPLAYILLNLERIRKGLGALGDAEAAKIADLEEATRMCIVGGRRVQSIVNDLRQFSRSEDERVPVDVRRVLDFAIDMSSHQLAPRAQLVRDFGDVPCVLASEGRLGQLFLNLLVNAAQSIRPGAPEANEVRVVTQTDDAGRVVVDVRDTGEGMSAHTRQRIFEPFFTTKGGEGTGLGLAICQGIVLSLGGQLTVESTPGIGSTFRLTLPPAADVG